LHQVKICLHLVKTDATTRAESDAEERVGLKTSRELALHRRKGEVR
jgi:hypothetical protein